MPRSVRYRAALLAVLTVVLAAPGRADETRPEATAADLLRRAHELARAEKHDEADAALRALLRVDPDHEIARARLGYVKTKDGWAQRAAGRTRVASTGLLTAYARADTKGRDAIRARVRSLEPAQRTPLLRAALGHEHAAVRRLAVAEVAHGRHADLAGALVKTGLDDASKSIRTAALTALRELPDTDAIGLLAHAAEGGAEAQSARRVRAIEALGASGDQAAVRYLVALHEVRGGGAPRVAFSDLSQLTFVQDFDVEVASTAFIADPQIGTVQDGRVLDVQVVATGGTSVRVERTAVHRALRTLTGAHEVKDTKGAWLAWWKNRERATASNG